MNVKVLASAAAPEAVPILDTMASGRIEALERQIAARLSEAAAADQQAEAAAARARSLRDVAESLINEAVEIGASREADLLRNEARISASEADAFEAQARRHLVESRRARGQAETARVKLSALP